MVANPLICTLRLMANNPLIRVVSILNFVFIAAHVVYSAILTKQNKSARPVGYAVANGASNSPWASRNMGLLGTILLLFILVHLRGFWYEVKFGEMPMVTYEESGTIKDVYTIVAASYENVGYALFYVVCMGFLAFHLSHGFSSAFQTLGLNHVKYSPVIKKVGYAITILIPTLFAAIPVVMYIQSLS
ncbi:succinate dehydrogenase (or fumarate reductase) cytochrome b subunit, b558 family protein [Nitritalea halalkaliphila LW7]|uniref:Succinate dehydrogenase (Or fumarate reductase) cytochrome b subunit, b558 family protein n=2 Tax=Nitritalea TaxID=1187887 RepID=I5BY23_9BACT|nr:succinate dehydrogenase (or fumarate reductase) cytochrome b subunit, b558 family protein [Nitritalea halalkaliphila LW7]